MDNPLASLDMPGLWKYSRDFIPRRPYVYINLFNNQWTTNFRMWNSGTWTSRVRIWPASQPDNERFLITPSLEARYPLQAAAAEGAAGSLPATQRGLELSRRGILVTAFGANPDGPGTLLRLWELAGQSGTCKVTLPAGMKAESVQGVNLRGQPAGAPIRVENGAFIIDVKAYAPASLITSTRQVTSVGWACPASTRMPTPADQAYSPKDISGGRCGHGTHGTQLIPTRALPCGCAPPGNMGTPTPASLGKRT